MLPINKTLRLVLPKIVVFPGSNLTKNIVLCMVTVCWYFIFLAAKMYSWATYQSHNKIIYAWEKYNVISLLSFANINVSWNVWRKFLWLCVNNNLNCPCFLSRNRWLSSCPFLYFCWFLYLGKCSPSNCCLSHLKGENNMTLAINDLRWVFNFHFSN